MMGRQDAALSVVIVTRDVFASIRRSVGHLRVQTIADSVELVIVAPTAEAVDAAPDELEGFAAVQIVPTGRIDSRGRAAAHGVRAARAPLVALLENHAFPDAGWAAALVDAHRGPWAAAGPVVRNANPESAVSRATFCMTYGPLAAPAAPGPRGHLAYHNSAFKRDVLEGYGTRLDELLHREGELYEDLARRGRIAYLEPRAAIAHANPSALGDAMRLFVQYGRLLGARRARAWSPARRAMYLVGAPLIPWRNLGRVLKDVRRISERRAETGRLLPLILLFLTASAAGEVAAYLAGPGDAAAWLNEHEFHGDAERRVRPTAVPAP